MSSRMFTADGIGKVNRSVLTGPIRLGPVVHVRAIQPEDEPIFHRMVAEWGYPPVGAPWTGQQPIEGRVINEVPFVQVQLALELASDELR